VQIEAVDAQWRFDSEKAHAALGRAAVAVRSGLTEMRRALKALRASPLEDLGFDLAVAELIEHARQRSDAEVRLAVSGEPVQLSAEVEHALYRVLQEALENIVRHAEARSVQVTLRRESDAVEIVVSDDGIGFDPAMVRADAQRFGLRGIFERIESLGGRVAVDSAIGRGTRILVRAGNSPFDPTKVLPRSVLESGKRFTMFVKEGRT